MGMTIVYIIFWMIFISQWISISSIKSNDIESYPSNLPPVIDLVSFIKVNEYSDNDRNSVINEIRKACLKWGLFHVINHNLTQLDELIIKNESRSFFQLPYMEKVNIKRNIKNSRGFADDELTKQKRDVKQIYDVGADQTGDAIDGYNQWPSDLLLPNFKSNIFHYFSKCNLIAELIINLIGISFGLENNIFSQHFTTHSSFLRLNYYPIPLPEETSSLGISRHTDAGAITILLQDTNVSSLEVYSGSKEEFHDGEWISVDPIPGSLIVNTGDMIQVWTNGKYKAAEHRVIASRTNERYSIAFFYNPNYNSVISPLILTNNEKAKYRPINWGEFRRNRFLGDYADFGKETQIEDYVINVENEEL